MQIGSRPAIIGALACCVLGVCSFGRGAAIESPRIASITNSGSADPAASSTVELLAMLFQGARKLEDYVAARELSSIHNEDLILSMAVTGLMRETNLAARADAGAFKSDLAMFGQAVTSLHAAADRGRHVESEIELRSVIMWCEKVTKYFPGSTLQAARLLAGRFMCAAHPEMIGKRGQVCPKCGAAFDQPLRLLPPFCGALSASPSIRAAIRTERPLAVGQPVRAHLRLENAAGVPLLASDLIETHAARIHLMMIDSSLTDYHHEHPRPTRVEGEYSFTFTPRKPGGYRAWVALRPQPMGLEQYAMTDIAAPSKGEPLTDRTVTFKTSVDGLDYELIPAGKVIKAGAPSPVKLRVTHPDGSGFAHLEPVMTDFAHVVGFNEDYKSIFHVHPKGGLIENPAERGGPELEFLVYAMQPGFVRLFVQVQVGGQMKFAPFGLQIMP